MSVIASVVGLAERASLPDVVTRRGIDFLVGRTSRRLSKGAADIRSFVEDMEQGPIAAYPEQANTQHYELPPRFFSLVLGPHRKYSCGFYEDAATTLAQAEWRALEETALHADLADGQSILELGCGWGSLSLFMAERFPRARITAVSNSMSQRLVIESQAKERGLTNLSVVTADMNHFSTEERFDRIVSVEMFEHMSNWRALLRRARSWLAGDGRLFLHVFTHRTSPYRFRHDVEADWIGRHFFTGGIMPSHNLIRQYEDLFSIDREWRWNGRHYRRTAEDWLTHFDRHRTEIDEIFRSVYGADASLWGQRWRLFFLATSGLFGHADGEEWGVSHYRLRPA